MLIKNAWKLGSGIFFDKALRKKIIGLCFFSIMFEFTVVFFQYILSYWSNSFYTALQNFDKDALYNIMLQFCLLVVASVIIVAFRYTFQAKLAIVWRQWMTQFYIDKWLSHNAYFGINLLTNKNDNPDQRISDDVNSFIGLTISITLGFLNSVVTLMSFLFLLWKLSGDTKFNIFNLEINISGYFVWIAIIYSIIGTLVTYVIGKKLTFLDYARERREANFRFSLMRLRENSESIALYNGAEYEKSIFKDIFEKIVNNFHDIIKITRNLTSWNNLYFNFSNILPIAVTLPKFFAKEIQLGDLMQISSAFSQVHSALSFFINSFSMIASYKAAISRLLEFNTNVDMWNNKVESFTVNFIKSDKIELKNIEIYLPNGNALLPNIDLSFENGHSYLLTGENGAGKSTLCKVIGGIWPFAKGEINIMKKNEIFFIPQKIYMPFGLLKDVITYPLKNLEKEEQIKFLLKKFNISYLNDRLNQEELWSNTLSVGEQQKISIMRAIIANPKVLIMDESTSALTETDEQLIFSVLKELLKDVTIISVGHRGGLRDCHLHEIKIGA